MALMMRLLRVIGRTLYSDRQNLKRQENRFVTFMMVEFNGDTVL